MGDEWKWDTDDHLHDEVMRYALDAWKDEYENLNREPDSRFSSRDANQITMSTAGTEMLRIAEDGFYVRGIRVEADEREAKIVYEAFKAFLAWSELSRK
jgi:hypothetical protein